MAFWLFFVGGEIRKPIQTLLTSTGLMGRFGRDGIVSNTTTWVVLENPPVSHAITAFSYLFVGSNFIGLILTLASFATTWGPVSWFICLVLSIANFLGLTQLKSLQPMSAPNLWHLQLPLIGLSILL